MTRDLRPSSAPPFEDTSSAPGSEPPPTEEEALAAAATREALARGEDPLAHALRAAHAPAPLDEHLLDALVARALAAPASAASSVTVSASYEGQHLERAPTPQELAGAEALRDALSRGEAPPAGEAAFAAALAAAYRPREIDPAVNEALLERALAAAPAARPRLALVRGGAEAGEAKGASHAAPRRARIARTVVTALASVAALAAGIALASGKLAARGDHASLAEVAPAAPLRVALVHERSTDDLFDPAQRFAVGRQSERVDRIARARAADLRTNRFAAWGVQ